MALRRAQIALGRRQATVYFLSAISSMYHGQKFWGFRLVVAFLITVIFMILLLLG